MREKIISTKDVMRDVLDQIYELYVRRDVRPHLDYGDIIYLKFDPEFTLEFTGKLESTQYTAARAVSGAWPGTNRNKLYEELGREYLYHRRWYKRLRTFDSNRSTGQILIKFLSN